MGTDALIERDEERAALDAALRDALEGHGSLVLVTGEAGIGKTRLTEEVVGEAGVSLLRGAPGPGTIAYGPVVAAFRSHMRTRPDGLSSCGPLQPHLAMLLPELGGAVAESDRATLFEAIRCALAAIAADGPAVLLLDDLQWSDATTLELLSALSTALQELPILVVGAYRSEEIPQGHPIRRLRNELRRKGVLVEIDLKPLSEDGTAVLAASVLGSAPSPALARTLQDRTNGTPFFVEELAAALEADARLQSGEEGLELELDADVPLPQTVRDAVLLHASGLSPEARSTAEAAAVAGTRFDIELLAELACADGLDELTTNGMIVETEPGLAAFRHPIARDAIYADVPWVRRRSLHRDIATALSESGGNHADVAGHWLAARDSARALTALILATEEFAVLHAYRDAADAGRQALDLWPEGERGEERIAFLEQHARFSELAGELAEATRAQREVVSARRIESAGRALADAERNLATIYELQGDRERALTARKVAADAYAANGLPGDAAAERLIVAGYLQSRGEYGEAVALTRLAIEESDRADRVDLRARALGLQGVAAVKGGDFEGGAETIGTGLALALEHELTLVAAEVYQRLGTAREISGDYGGAHEALTTAVGFCETDGAEGLEQTCLSCIAYVLRELGDWDRASELCDELLTPEASAGDTLVADGVLGAIAGFRGDAATARPLLDRCRATATTLDVVSMGVDSAAALAWLDEHVGDLEAARANCAWLLDRWERSEDHHYGVWGLRWAACFFARLGDLAGARACTAALSSIATTTGHPDVLAALAHALGETALAEGHPDSAVEQIQRAADLHETLEIPFERAQIEYRLGVALVAAGEREPARERLRIAYELADRLGALPLGAQIVEQVTELGEPIEGLLGRRAAATHENSGLSRRELEVMRLVASGRTNREIAAELVLSPRTIDMHVRNILGKLDCRSRTEATSKAADLGLLA
jgi:DNA-binding CsgD family transcriptional regulator